MPLRLCWHDAAAAALVGRQGRKQTRVVWLRMQQAACPGQCPSPSPCLSLALMLLLLLLQVLQEGPC
jgi:hypothetical protein